VVLAVCKGVNAHQQFLTYLADSPNSTSPSFGSGYIDKHKHYDFMIDLMTPWTLLLQDRMVNE
jgi:hypothetical protein